MEVWCIMKTVVNKHIGCYGIIIKDDKIVLIKKARGGYKGKLDLPGGGMEHTELPIETLKREIIEEAGVNAKKIELFDVTATNIKWQVNNDLEEDLHHIGILYLVEITNDKLKEDADVLDSEGASWYEINALNKNNLSPFTIYALEKLNYKIGE